MNRTRLAAAILPLSAMAFASPFPAHAAEGPPEWAYQITPARFKAPPGFRVGAFAGVMKDVVVKPQEEDMLAIAAYLATQTP